MSRIWTAARRFSALAASVVVASIVLPHSARALDPVARGAASTPGLPHYVTLNLTREEADILRRAFGIEDPHRLYFSDTTSDAVLKYDTQEKRCAECLVNSYRVGYISVRRPDETWEEAEHRVLKTPHREFLGAGNVETSSTSMLDPEVRPVAEAMLRAARAAGFRVRVAGTYRSPVREAFVMSLGRGRTHTLTSSHSYGRAIDVVVDDGRLTHKRTVRDWVAFRRWVTQYHTGARESFHVLGTVTDTWDWPHIELPSPEVGFKSVEEAIARGRACLAPGSRLSCDFQPHLPHEPANVVDSSKQSPAR